MESLFIKGTSLATREMYHHDERIYKYTEYKSYRSGGQINPPT
ncbi:MAG: hypothetical protein WC623_07160 [Pedobacter sp.]